MFDKESMKAIYDLISDDDKKLMKETLQTLFNKRIELLDKNIADKKSTVNAMNIWAIACLEEFIRVMTVVNRDKIAGILTLAILSVENPEILPNMDIPETTTNETDENEITKRKILH